MTRGPVLVTGGRGFIGKAMIRALMREGITPFAPSRAELDLLDRDAVGHAIATIAPATVFHLASPGVFAREQTGQLIADEVAIARNVAAALPSGVTLVSAGSMAEYGSSGRHREADACAPRNAYAEAKVAAGREVLRIGAERGLRVTIARIFGAYGPGEALPRLFPAALERLKEGEPIALSEGTQLRDFVHVADVARALRALAAVDALPAYVNVGTGQALTMRAVLPRLVRDLGSDEGLLRFGAIPRSIHDQDVLEADTTLLAATIGWVPPQRLAGDGPVLPLLLEDPA